MSMTQAGKALTVLQLVYKNNKKNTANISFIPVNVILALPDSKAH